MGSIWHIGIAVPDLEKGQKELGEVFGLRWRPARVRKPPLKQHKENTMRIGIIGAGNMGATLAAQLTRLGHQVAIANSRGPQTLTGVTAQTGAVPVPITDVTSKADVVIVAIPEKSITELPAGLLSALPED